MTRKHEGDTSTNSPSFGTLVMVGMFIVLLIIGSVIIGVNIAIP